MKKTTSFRSRLLSAHKNLFKFLLILTALFVSAPFSGYADKAPQHLSPQLQLEYYQKQIDSAEQQRNVSKMASGYGAIVALCRNAPALKNELPENLYQYALWSSYTGDYHASIQASIEILEMSGEAEDKTLFKLKARANMQLGVTYFFMERWDDALAHYQKAKEMATKLNDYQGISIAENNIGNIYQKKGDYQKAIERYQNSLQLQEDIGDLESICNTYFNMGSCYQELEDEEASIPYFNQALEIAKEIGESEIYALSLSELACYNALKKNRFHEAEIQITEAEKVAEESGYKQVLNEIYHKKSQIEEKKGNYQSALEYYKKYKQLSDTLFKESSAERLHEYEVRYQTQEKELEITRQQAVIHRQNIFRTILVIGLILTAFILFLLWGLLRLRTKRNKELREMNTTKDKFFSIISHDLKSPTIAQRNALQTLVDHSDEWDKTFLKQYCAELLRSAEKELELLYNLLNWAQAQTGRMPYRPAPFDLTKAVETEINLMKNMIDNKEIALFLQAPKETVVRGDRNMIATVVRNLLINAVKFTKNGGEISVEITETDDGKYYVGIRDTGIGMSKEQINMLFRLDRQPFNPETTEEPSNGLGLIVCKELLEKHGAILEIESEPKKGSRFGFAVKRF